MCGCPFQEFEVMAKEGIKNKRELRLIKRIFLMLMKFEESPFFTIKKYVATLSAYGTYHYICVTV